MLSQRGSNHVFQFLYYDHGWFFSGKRGHSRMSPEYSILSIDDNKIIIITCALSRLVPFGVVASGSATTNVICNRIPDLTPKQRAICNSRPDAMAAVGDGDQLALLECRFQMRFNRWNCTNIGGNSSTLGTSLVSKYILNYCSALCRVCLNIRLLLFWRRWLQTTTGSDDDDDRQGRSYK